MRCQKPVAVAGALSPTRLLSTAHFRLQLFASVCVGNALTTIPPLRYTHCYDYQICCPHFFNRLWQPMRCARSITHPERVARRIAFTSRVTTGFAQGEAHSKEGQA